MPAGVQARARTRQGRARLYPQDSRKGFNAQVSWQDTEEPKQHPSSDAAPSPLGSKDMEGKEWAVPCSPESETGSVLTASSSRSPKGLVRLHRCVHMGSVPHHFPAGGLRGDEVATAQGRCPPGHKTWQARGNLEGLNLSLQGLRLHTKVGWGWGSSSVRAPALYCRPWELGSAPPALCALFSHRCQRRLQGILTSAIHTLQRLILMSGSMCMGLVWRWRHRE